MKRALLLLFTVLGLGSSIACGPATESARVNNYPEPVMQTETETESTQTADTAPVEVAVDSSLMGESIYAAQCASCHGVNLEGQPNWQEQTADGKVLAPPHDETGHTWHHSDAHLLDRIRYGTANLSPQMQTASNMPAYDGVLTEAEMVAVLDYIKASWPADILASQESRN